MYRRAEHFSDVAAVLERLSALSAAETGEPEWTLETVCEHSATTALLEPDDIEAIAAQVGLAPTRGMADLARAAEAQHGRVSAAALLVSAAHRASHTRLAAKAFDAGLRLCRAAFELGQAIGDRQAAGLALHGAYARNKLGQPGPAAEMLAQSIDIAGAMGEVDKVAWRSVTFSRLCRANGRAEDARTILNTGRAAAVAMVDRDLRTARFLDLGGEYLALGEPGDAQTCFAEALIGAAATGDRATRARTQAGLDEAQEAA